MIKHLLVLVLGAVGCRSGHSDPTAGSHAAAANTAVITTKDSAARTARRALKDKNEMMGWWQRADKELLTVHIKERSINYPDHRESHKYKLKGDSIFIHYLDFILAARVYVHRDTLIMISEGGESKYVKLR